MNQDSKAVQTREQEPGNLLILAVLAVAVGAAAGLLTAVFRLALGRADQLRNLIVVRAHGQGVLGAAAVVAAAAAATGVAAWLVRRFAPSAKGSGIPHVEAVLKDEVSIAPPRLLIVKFVGGVLGIGAGLALGREGPSVQMGAGLANAIAGFFRRNKADVKALLAAGAGAGLATAFNAPVAGAVFILEEVVRRFDIRHSITTLGARPAPSPRRGCSSAGRPTSTWNRCPTPAPKRCRSSSRWAWSPALSGWLTITRSSAPSRSRNVSAAGRWKCGPR